MLTVQNDWVQYDSMPARRVAVRGGAACAHRLPVRTQPVRPAGVRVERRPAPQLAAVPSRAVGRQRLRLTRRGRVVLVLLPALLAAGGSLIAFEGVAAAPGAAITPAAVVQAVGR